MTVTEDVLRAWREAERLLATLPPLSPHEETVRLAILTMRECYQELTRQRPPRQEAVARGRQTAEHAQILIAEIRANTGRGLAMGDIAFGEAPG